MADVMNRHSGSTVANTDANHRNGETDATANRKSEDGRENMSPSNQEAGKGKTKKKKHKRKTTTTTTATEKTAAVCVEKDGGVEQYRHPAAQAKFKPDAYLNDFYSDMEDEPAMKIVMLFMPNIVRRLPPLGLFSLLDIGSGPTVHMAFLFRKIIREVYLSDYASANVGALRAWRSGGSTFDWSSVAKFIAHLEGEGIDAWKTMEAEARKVVRGAFLCDIFTPNVLLEGPVNRQFDVVTTAFCCEASCTTEDRYREGIGNIVSKIKPGGFLVMAGIFQETWYKYDHERYHCMYLTEEVMLATLQEHDMDMREGSYFFLNHEGIFVIMCQKLDLKAYWFSDTDSDPTPPPSPPPVNAHRKVLNIPSFQSPLGAGASASDHASTSGDRKKVDKPNPRDQIGRAHV